MRGQVEGLTRHALPFSRHLGDSVFHAAGTWVGSLPRPGLGVLCCLALSPRHRRPGSQDAVVHRGPHVVLCTAERPRAFLLTGLRVQRSPSGRRQRTFGALASRGCPRSLAHGPWGSHGLSWASVAGNLGLAGKPNSQPSQGTLRSPLPQGHLKPKQGPSQATSEHPA